MKDDEKTVTHVDIQRVSDQQATGWKNTLASTLETVLNALRDAAFDAYQATPDGSEEEERAERVLDLAGAARGLYDVVRGRVVSLDDIDHRLNAAGLPAAGEAQSSDSVSTVSERKAKS